MLLNGPLESLQGPERPMQTQHKLSIRSITNLAESFAVFEVKNTERTAFDSFITVGRTANNDVVIPDITVSKMHALIHPRDEGYFIVDGGSSSGTFVNDQPAPTRKTSEALPLRSGDALRLGSVDLVFLSAAALIARAHGDASAR